MELSARQVLAALTIPLFIGLAFSGIGAASAVAAVNQPASLGSINTDGDGSQSQSPPTTQPPAPSEPASCSKLISGGSTDRWAFTTTNDITGTAQLAPTVSSSASTPAPTMSPTPAPTDSSTSPPAPTSTPIPTDSPTSAASPVKVTGSLQYDISIRRGRYFETLGSTCAPAGKQYVVVIYSGTPSVAVTDGYGYDFNAPTPVESNSKYTLTSGSESYQPTQTLAANDGVAVVFETPKNESSFGFSSTLAFNATRDTSNDSAVKSEDPNYSSVPTTVAASFSVGTVQPVSVTAPGETCEQLSVGDSGQQCNENVSGGF
jgi:hypothetical protein